MADLSVHAPAKINLGLEVLRRREDGFHDLNTVFAPISLHDTLVLTTTVGRIQCSVAGAAAIPTDESNLAVRAAMRLRSALGIDRGLLIELRKEIPVGGGLGGGSSDAAAVLTALGPLWDLPVESRLLHELALELGSDVPFFLDPRPSLASSRGEVLRPVELELPWSVLLVNDGTHVPTGWAYTALRRTAERAPTDLCAALAAAIESPEVLRKSVVNDFEEVVFDRYARLAQIKERLYSSGAEFALMSGSGGTMFALYRSESAARSAADEFRQDWTRVVRFVTAVSS